MRLLPLEAIGTWAALGSMSATLKLGKVFAGFEFSADCLWKILGISGIDLSALSSYSKKGLALAFF